MPRADLVVLADCGHLAPMEEPGAVTHALLRLLRRQS
jgi:pimeloyl-ACP methyl ester carboxylesterase